MKIRNGLTDHGIRHSEIRVKVRKIAPHPALRTQLGAVRCDPDFKISRVRCGAVR